MHFLIMLIPVLTMVHTIFETVSWIQKEMFAHHQYYECERVLRYCSQFFAYKENYSDMTKFFDHPTLETSKTEEIRDEGFCNTFTCYGFYPGAIRKRQRHYPQFWPLWKAQISSIPQERK